MKENTNGIIAIELLSACQGIDFRRPLKTSPSLEKVYHVIRKEVACYDEDRFFAPDILAAKKIIHSAVLSQTTGLDSFFQ